VSETGRTREGKSCGSVEEQGFARRPGRVNWWLGDAGSERRANLVDTDAAEPDFVELLGGARTAFLDFSTRRRVPGRAIRLPAVFFTT